MTFNPVPKVKYKRRKPTRKKRSEFSEKVRNEIMEEFEHSCGVCHGQASQIHHVRFRSRKGRGVKTNGLPVCQTCHADIHNDNEKARFWEDMFLKMYGHDYYKDEWD